MAAAPVLVQESTLAIAASSSITPTLPSGSTAGNLLIVVLAADFSGSSAPSTPTGWTLLVWGGTNAGLAAPEMDIFYKNNCSANETLPTFQRISATKVMCIAYEYSGQDLHDPLNAGITSVNSGGFTSAAMNMSSNTVAVNTIFSAICLYNATANSQTVSYSSGWTADQNDGTVSDLHLATANWTAGGLPTSETISWSSAQQYSGFIIYVQAPHITNVSLGTVAVGTTSASPTFAQATTAGNTLIAVVAAKGSSVLTITCSNGTWTQAGQSLGSTEPGAVFFKSNCSASETAPTFTATGATNIAVVLSEFAGIANVNPVDQINTSGQWFGTGNINALFLPDTTSSDLCVFGAGLVCSKSCTLTISDSWSPAGGQAGVLGTTSAKASWQFHASYYLLNGAGGTSKDSVTWTWSLSTGTGTGTQGVMVSFMADQSAPLYRNSHSVTKLQAINRSAYY